MPERTSNLRSISLSFIAAALLTASSAHIAAADPEKIELISGPFGTGSYVLGNALEQITMKSGGPVTVTSSETPGLVFNAKKLNSDAEMRKNTISSFTSGINYLAVNGEAPFEEKLPSAMLIANYSLGSVWLATFDETITSPEDLKGKRIALGRPPQILWTIEPELIIRHGWKLEGEMEIEKLGTKEAAQALLNGTVDAAIVGGYANPDTGEFLPSPQTVELLASGRKLHYVPWGDEAVKATIEAGVPIIPATVEQGAIEGLEQPIASFYDAVAWVAYPDFDEEAAYQLTKEIIDNVGLFADYHALGKLMSKQALPYGWNENQIHPGALRAYREAGLVK